MTTGQQNRKRSPSDQSSKSVRSRQQSLDPSLRARGAADHRCLLSRPADCPLQTVPSTSIKRDEVACKAGFQDLGFRVSSPSNSINREEAACKAIICPHSTQII